MILKMYTLNCDPKKADPKSFNGRNGGWGELYIFSTSILIFQVKQATDSFYHFILLLKHCNAGQKRCRYSDIFIH